VNKGGDMKQLVIGLLLGGMCFLLRIDVTHALSHPADAFTGAKTEASCLAIIDKVEFPKPSFSVIAQKTAPKNPIVVGQDKEKVGVNIIVTISSLSGTAIYPIWVRRVNRSQIQPIRKGGTPGAECFDISSTREYCEWVTYSCEPKTETIFRMLKPAKTQVWLDPTDETRGWLGWSEDRIGDPLRFVLPDDWGFGAWTPAGLKEWSNPGTGGEWWTFLYRDPLITHFPSTEMSIVSTPKPGDLYSTRQILGLFGTYTKFPGLPASSDLMNQCLIDDEVESSRGNCVIEPYGVIGTSKVTTLTFHFNNVPLDLPGRWRIGVVAYQLPAIYAGTRTENIDEYDLQLSIGPEGLGFPFYLYNNREDPMDYDMGPNKAFNSYIILATPCFNGDPESCVN
jgi:hypothetical protein